MLDRFNGHHDFFYRINAAVPDVSHQRITIKLRNTRGTLSNGNQPKRQIQRKWFLLSQKLGQSGEVW
ncbi:hypothetical protein ARC20_17610 [Stenotrophomonas panacihumi]|uniref:Uncharacterized protein n=1 Tax=Stenotrophomonas panacihumi TaxID=676599 RepID=A0A0R0ARJ2_9GAMM|nr:hypothetical protein ARC20_17610 [Stenotrophomonas panacihumi]